MKNFVIALALILFHFGVSAQTLSPESAQTISAENTQTISSESISKYAEISKILLENNQKSIPELMIIAAKQMLGTEYVAGTLEVIPEQLKVSLVETDCILLVESCLAMALNAKKGLSSPDDLCATIQSLRYRNGKVDGYASRNHYTSEWIRQGEANGIFKELTGELSGYNLSGQRFSYMREHSDAYKQLKGNPAERARIVAMEDELNKFEDYYVIPKEMISKIEDKLQDGDILGFNSSVEGLDIAHVAFVYKKESGEVGFLHASMVEGKVVIDQKSIADYAMDRKSCNGIRIIRVM